jgi:hypothetical protein
MPTTSAATAIAAVAAAVNAVQHTGISSYEAVFSYGIAKHSAGSAQQ